MKAPIVIIIFCLLIASPLRLLGEERPPVVDVLVNTHYNSEGGADTVNALRAANSWDKMILATDKWADPTTIISYARLTPNGIDAIKRTYTSSLIKITTSQSSMVWIADLTVSDEKLVGLPSFNVIDYAKSLIKSPSSMFPPDRIVPDNWFTNLKITQMGPTSVRIWTIKAQAVISSTAVSWDLEQNKPWFRIPKERGSRKSNASS
ncbi:MAG: hypothetical protein WC661_21660 [Opitutaceae bacterium]|jgi:hypothetical protein